MLTVMVLWTAFASVFALVLGYSRVPYAAALDGYFFKPFAKLHAGGVPEPVAAGDRRPGDSWPRSWTWIG